MALTNVVVCASVWRDVASVWRDMQMYTHTHKQKLPTLQNQRITPKTKKPLSFALKGLSICVEFHTPYGHASQEVGQAS